MEKWPLKGARVPTHVLPRLVVYLGVITGHGGVVPRQMVVGSAADGDRRAADGHLFHQLVLEHQAELRHFTNLLRSRCSRFSWAPRGPPHACRSAATKTIRSSADRTELRSQ